MGSHYLVKLTSNSCIPYFSLCAVLVLLVTKHAKGRIRWWTWSYLNHKQVEGIEENLA